MYSVCIIISIRTNSPQLKAMNLLCFVVPISQFKWFVAAIWQIQVLIISPPAMMSRTDNIDTLAFAGAVME